MKARVTMLVAVLLVARIGARAQETQAEPTPVLPVAPQTTHRSLSRRRAEHNHKAAPVVRRASKPSANSRLSRWRGR
jgi:hypothetical protein